ncbi:class I SAM-dependent methyltransferase [Marinobacterium sedimentorum]|uniref:class I SAM-dependent methyltransferase n=1 Tax=Marinobacterium sedimentorum TaxID=2927804 RepID=UPI0020C741B0|nr:methyltransferase domain-containing protein [Marinobacterium sedimentorum]MCP8686544.1 class I SAM-dependent methyltransferase [Marinobacterium sedimentorum]
MNQPQSRNPAETYEHYFVPAMFLPWATLLLRHAAPQAGERVLDVACGTGIVARQAAPMVGADGQVVAIDMNPAMLAVARAQPVPSGATINWQEGNAMALPSPDGAFDVVLCQHGLQFMPDPVGALSEMHRVLAPGGRALVIVLQALGRHPVFEALMESVARQLSLPVSAVMTPFALHDADELRALCTAAGFKKVDILLESTKVRFPEPERFVPLAVSSSAAAVPAFAQLDAPARAALLEAVRVEVEPTVRKYSDADSVSFPMFAHIAVASL